MGSNCRYGARYKYHGPPSTVQPRTAPRPASWTTRSGTTSASWLCSRAWAWVKIGCSCCPQISVVYMNMMIDRERDIYIYIYIYLYIQICVYDGRYRMKYFLVSYPRPPQRMLGFLVRSLSGNLPRSVAKTVLG